MSDHNQNPIRYWRRKNSLSLDRACDMFRDLGFDRPSTAKLSRIERFQSVPTEMLNAISVVTGLSAAEVRPDLAKAFKEPSQ